MKIVLHGATSGSNFGDFLFADMILRTVLECNPDGKNGFFRFPIFGVSSYFSKYLPLAQRLSFIDLFTGDLLIYIPGGYFGDSKKTLVGSIKRFLRYMPIGFLFCLRRKPVIILGVGGGPLHYKFLRDAALYLFKRAAVVTVRDIETATYFKSYGIKREILVKSDLVQAMPLEMIPLLESDIKATLDNALGKKKLLLLHIEKTDRANEKLKAVFEGVRKFLEKRKEFGVVVACSNLHKPLNRLAVGRSINNESIVYYQFDSPWQFAALIGKVDLVVTTRLHVGIVAAVLSKSVVAFPSHKEKTPRFYRQLGASSRCRVLAEASPQDVYDTLVMHYENPIRIPENVKLLAADNLTVLSETISRLKQAGSVAK